MTGPDLQLNSMTDASVPFGACNLAAENRRRIIQCASTEASFLPTSPVPALHELSCH